MVPSPERNPQLPLIYPIHKNFILNKRQCMQNFKISCIAVIFLFNLEIYYDAIKILIEIQKANQRHRTPHDFTSHTTNENL